MMAYTYTYLGLNLVLFIAFVQELLVVRFCRFSPSPADLGPIMFCSRQVPTATHLRSLTTATKPVITNICTPKRVPHSIV